MKWGKKLIKSLLGDGNKSLKSESSISSIDEELNLPDRVELIKDQLFVSIFHHKVDLYAAEDLENSIDSIAFLTEGMYDKGQKELFLALVNVEDFQSGLRQIFDLFKHIYKLTLEGRTVDAYGTTKLNNPIIWGHTAIIYMDLPSAIHADLLYPTLSMVLLRKEEADVLDWQGELRLLSLLGNQTRYFPFPYWVDVKRKLLDIDVISSKTMLKNVGMRASWFDSYVYLNQAENQIYFRLAKNFSNDVPEEIINQQFIGYLLPALYPNAEACLTFRTDDINMPTVISKHDCEFNTISGCFLVIMSNQEEYFCRIIEDGFGIFLTKEQWEGFWRAINERTEYFLENEGQISFKLEWE